MKHSAFAVVIKKAVMIVTLCSQFVIQVMELKQKSVLASVTFKAVHVSIQRLRLSLVI